MDAKSVMTAVRLASQRDAAVTAKAEAAATVAGSNTAGISFEHSNVTDTPLFHCICEWAVAGRNV